MKKIIFIIFIAFLVGKNVYANEVNEVIDYNFFELDEVVEEKIDLSFNELIKKYMAGEDVYESIKESFFNKVKGELFYNNDYIKNIVLISIISALINILIADLKDKSVCELVSLIGQIMVIGLATASFKSSIFLLINSLNDVLDIINSAIPFIIMFISASGRIYGGALMTFGTSIVASGIQRVIVPILAFELLIKIVNIISKKNLLNKLSNLFSLCIKWGLKIFSYGFMFLVGIERISGGSINKFVGNYFKGVIKMVPIIGDVFSGASDIAIGVISGVKNGTALLIMVVIFLIVIVPILKIAIVGFTYKMIAGFLEPICEKQIIEIIDVVGNSTFLVLSALFLISFMFFISCGITLCGVWNDGFC